MGLSTDEQLQQSRQTLHFVRSIPLRINAVPKKKNHPNGWFFFLVELRDNQSWLQNLPVNISTHSATGFTCRSTIWNILRAEIYNVTSHKNGKETETWTT